MTTINRKPDYQVYSTNESFTKFMESKIAEVMNVYSIEELLVLQDCQKSIILGPGLGVIGI